MHVLVTLFKECDLDGDGNVSAKELRRALSSQKFEDSVNQEIRKILKAIKGKVDHIGWKEFVATTYGDDLVTKITPSDLEAMIEIFKSIDVDGDGVLTIDEITGALLSGNFEQHITSEIEEMCIIAETQGRDYLSWDDFINRALNGGNQTAPGRTKRWGKQEIDATDTETLVEIFKTIDVDGNGSLEVTEVRQVLRSGRFNEQVNAKLREMLEEMKTTNAPISWREFLEREGINELDQNQIINASPDEVNALLGMFRAIDEDGDGNLSIQELNTAYESNNFGEYVNMELLAMMQIAKHLGKESMTWNEFMYHALHPHSDERQELIEENILEDNPNSRGHHLEEVRVCEGWREERKTNATAVLTP